MSPFSFLFATALSAVALATSMHPQVNQPILLASAFSNVVPPTARPVSHHVQANFEVVAGSGVPAMHAALLQNGRVVFLDKVETYTDLKMDNGRYAFSSIYDPETQNLTTLEVRSNAFCSAGTFLADGRLVSVGGNTELEWLDPTVKNGIDAVRYLDVQQLNQGWVEPGNKLASNRWYASTQALHDGRIFIASGSLNALDVNNKSNNNPTYEVLDNKGMSDGKNVGMDILSENQPY